MIGFPRGDQVMNDLPMMPSIDEDTLALMVHAPWRALSMKPPDVSVQTSQG
jgi:hypothetical protein